MALTFIATDKKDLTPRITVFGVGGAGGNAVNNMIEQNLEGVDFVVANTDAQALQQSRAPVRVQLGVQATEGLGAGARPEVGAAAAAETLEEIMDHLTGAHMCFITAGMGGGTGTGAAPIIAHAAREMGILTVGVVTKPFAFEGAKRMRQAEEGVEELQKVVDTLIIIPNQNLFRLANERTTFTEAFALADDVLYQGVKGVTDLMVRPGMINLDFADVRAVMDEMGKAMMGTGEATGEDRARQAAEKAIANPLLDEISLHGAKGVLINITGGHDLTLFELDEAANLIREKVDPEANIIVGSTLDETMEGAIRVSVVATGIEAREQTVEVPRRRLAEPLTVEAAPVAPAPVQEPAAYEPPMFEAPQEPPYREERYDEAAYEPQYDEQAYDERFEPQPEPRQQTAYRDEQPRHEPRHEQMREAPAAPAPVQDDFFLEDILRDQPRVQQRAAPQPTRAAPPPVQQQPVQQPVQQQADAQYTAPRPNRNVGEPSPEVLARLRRVVEKQPEQQQPVNRRPVAAPVPQPVAQPEPRRSLVGGLLGRMTGAQAPQASHGEQAARAVRQQPVVQAYDDDPHHRAQDQIEIPAFLRRQAN